MESPDTTTALEQQVTHALLRPAARLALRCGISLREIGAAMQLATFHELQDRGLKMREISEHLGISMRKTALLSSDLKHAFFDLMRDAELPRRIEFLLWAKPISRARIAQTLPSTSSTEVARAIDKLVAEGRIVALRRANSTVYQRSARDARLVSDRIFARLDGLHHMLGCVYNTTWARFFADDKRSFARTVALRLRPQDLQELEAFYESTIWPKLTELESRCRDPEEPIDVDFALLWAPTPPRS